MYYCLQCYHQHPYLPMVRIPTDHDHRCYSYKNSNHHFVIVLVPSSGFAFSNFVFVGLRLDFPKSIPFVIYYNIAHVILLISPFQMVSLANGSHNATELFSFDRYINQTTDARKSNKSVWNMFGKSSCVDICY